MAGDLAAQAIADGSDLIVAAGGDGTINEIAGGMVGSQVPLAILPAGTANVLAMEMGVGARWEWAAANLDRCIPQRISVGLLTTGGIERHFLLMAGAGFDAHVVYNVSAPLKASFGKIAYWIAGFSLFGRRLSQFQADVDGVRYTASFALISKVRNYGGDLEIARETSLFDDEFEIILFEGENSARYLKYLTGVALNKLKGMSGVHVLRARDVRLTGSPGERTYLQVDGEFVGRIPARIQTVPDALTLLIPECYFAKLGKPLPAVLAQP